MYSINLVIVQIKCLVVRPSFILNWFTVGSVVELYLRIWTKVEILLEFKLSLLEL